jgi:Zn-dependent peptidase ImmA (M78 family)
MRLIPDPTGRFTERPYYEGTELDQECERIVSEFLLDRYRRVSYPISTNDLCILVEDAAADFDEWADLSEDGPDVLGKTAFSRRGKPSIYISAGLQEPHRENRRRTTLGHELGHAKVHNYLVGFAAAADPACCTEGSIIGASTRAVDWLEWQAGYCSGAFLVPLGAVRKMVRKAKLELGIVGTPDCLTPEGQALIERVKVAFQVSADAARVRLLQLAFLTEQRPTDLASG